MDHAEARELLELAAVEPHGFERLMAGDTTEAAALAGHLAGCEECSDELARLRRAAGVIRDVVRTTPSPDLRERTLAFVRDVGRDRGPLSAAAGVSASPAISEIPSIADRRASDIEERPRRGLPTVAWLGAMAAVLVVAVAGTALVVRGQADDQLRRQITVAEQLGRVTSWYIAIEAQPDARKVSLASPTTPSATGTVEFSPTTHQVVVVATGLTEPAAGQPLGCWIEIDGARKPIGRMFFGGGLSYWVGPAEEVAALLPGTKFGVSAPGGDTLLEGEL